MSAIGTAMTRHPVAGVDVCSGRAVEWGVRDQAPGRRELPRLDHKDELGKSLANRQAAHQDRVISLIPNQRTALPSHLRYNTMALASIK